MTQSNKAIGGYFELELSCDRKDTYHSDAIALNSGRNSLKLILKERRVNHLYIPYYTCDAVLEPIDALNISFDFYHLDEALEIKGIDTLDEDSYLIYINYFGLKGSYIKKITQYFDNVIIDNSQAFYDKPQSHIDTFYSPRKFFGVPGGGYVYGPEVELNFKKDIVYDRCQHLLIRSEIEAEAGYKNYQENEEKFVGRSIKSMSVLTERLLSNIDYEAVRKQRIANYSFLHERVGNINALQNLADVAHTCPLVYPFKNEKINRKQMIGRRIYVPQYWPEIIVHLPSKSCVEYDMINNLLALPIDQRYSESAMQNIIDVITQYV